MPCELATEIYALSCRADQLDALFHFSSGTRTKLQRFLQDLLKALGLPAKKFGTHSLYVLGLRLLQQLPVSQWTSSKLWLGGPENAIYCQYIRAPHNALSELTHILCYD